MDFLNIIKEVFRENNIPLNDSEAEKLYIYGTFLKEYNEKVNLTAITEEREIAEKHFLDCCMAGELLNLPEGIKAIDVGTGAGFPSVPIAVLNPQMELTLLDSLNKRLKFLEELCSKIDVKAELVHGRAEEKGFNSPLRESFDIAFSRAVASLGALAEYCLPFVKVGGIMAALKGPKAKEEEESALKAIKVLGGGNIKEFPYSLPDGSERVLVTIEKIAPTPKKYPRQRIKINDNPIK